MVKKLQVLIHRKKQKNKKKLGQHQQIGSRRKTEIQYIKKKKKFALFGYYSHTNDLYATKWMPVVGFMDLDSIELE